MNYILHGSYAMPGKKIANIFETIKDIHMRVFGNHDEFNFTDARSRSCDADVMKTPYVYVETDNRNVRNAENVVRKILDETELHARLLVGRVTFFPNMRAGKE